ncbi:MAG TPA: hypothetical protein VJL62_03640 [Thermodesulfobacteriota bacterium]|nr:hypothetical protein [Thermodesulfobacteriota bacterium]
MTTDFYQTASGRKILLEQLHIQLFDIEWYVGEPELIRSRVLKELPEKACRIFPSNNGLLIKEAPRGEERAYPKYIFFAELLSPKPIHPEAHCSSLILVWFGDHLDFNLDQMVADNMRDIAWEEYAEDGYF